jgi:hypothetical protein
MLLEKSRARAEKNFSAQYAEKRWKLKKRKGWILKKIRPR